MGNVRMWQNTLLSRNSARGHCNADLSVVWQNSDLRIQQFLCWWWWRVINFGTVQNNICIFTLSVPIDVDLDTFQKEANNFTYIPPSP